MLNREAHLMLKLAQTTNLLMPSLYYVGEEKLPCGQRIFVVVMDLLGKNLDDIFYDFNRNLSLATVLKLAIMMVRTGVCSPTSPWQIKLVQQIH